MWPVFVVLGLGVKTYVFFLPFNKYLYGGHVLDKSAQCLIDFVVKKNMK